MKRSRKSYRVSWAPDVNLCQVKLFHRDDCPPKVGGECQDTRQGKTSGSLRPILKRANNLPRGFEGVHNVNGLKYGLAAMPRIPWTCPPKFVLNFNWRVAAAEESKEVKSQKLREMRVLEAVYPLHSAIPPSPSVSPDLDVKPYDDSQTPLVPLTPIEDGETAEFAAQEQTRSNSQTPALMMPTSLSGSGTHHLPPCPTSTAKSPVLDILPNLSSDVNVIASAVLSSISKSNKQGSLIDTDLLIKILSDPNMVKTLINDREHLTTAANGFSMPVFTPELKTGLPCTKSPAVSSQMPSDRNSNHFSKEFQPTTVPVSRADNVSVSNEVSMPVYTSELKTAINPLPAVSSQMPADRNSNNFSKEFQPKIIPASRADNVPISMYKSVESSVPLSGMDKNMIPGESTGNGNASFILNKVQPTVTKMPIQTNFVQEVQAPINFTPVQLNAGQSVAATKANPVKDINYFKNLIREHGREKPEAKGHNISQTGTHVNHTENLKLLQNLNPMAMNAKFRKPCMYFNSPRGCRNGSNCAFLHEKSFQFQTGTMLEAPNAKRMRLSCEITGRT
ncbi:hypothetical protein CCACVL1_26054 [Corchorus capsularis]|uniref:C3H1-type domain-containing protein n=1 Tax=Corchorus capsularis TaxID=210143 RepID=A0A1R3GG88_COCAP|nr:hypothetical protein CCACVL1_26054 [Corchorus capsularis]